MDGESSSLKAMKSSLGLIAHVFGQLGWEKKLKDLSEEEVLSLIVVLQSVKDIEHEYLNDYLREVYERYRIKRDEDGWIPF